MSLSNRIVVDGSKTLLWEDVWLEDKSLAQQFPKFYNVSFTNMVTVKQVKDAGWECFEFRSLHGKIAISGLQWG